MLRSRRARSTRRAGFTLLEILLATLIAVLLLAALYTMMTVTLRQTQVSRDASEVEDLSRGIFNKMTVDLNGVLAPLPPRSGGNPLASTSSSSTQSATTSSGTGDTTGSSGSTTPATSAASAPTTGTTTSGTGTTSTDASTDTTSTGAADSSFQGGVIGKDKRLTVFAGRVPEVFGRFGERSEQVRADQRQIIYWVGDGGLYRLERPWVTSDDVRSSLESDADPDPESPDAVLVAPEVSDVTFEYTDGSSWVAEWNGADPGPDGVTPLGPPRAIRITLVIKVSTGRSNETVEKTLTQVIPVRSAPGTNTPVFVEPPVDGATDTSSGTTSGSSSTGSGTTGSTGGASSSGGTGSSGGGTTSSPSTGSSGGTKQSASSGASMGSGSTGGKSGGGK
ncbi:prepilin-type N-terminal cleavage/methylation domain-containing protein [Gemmata sp. SH-PL17]|uniref:prepilin-type N-terminal cleavage/methylation domain-containing protein n=1 Tax=Gemmata sp. SH-PL17 TaxID=1630693 RepID=UPI0009ECF11A|nr:prepilin-type N-terminal cleavage/methylation domain-containing protein [Gemmata sp. SH-PL17]